MIISVNWLKKYTDIDRSIDELAKLIGARLVEIEEVQDVSRKYQGIVLARVMSCDPVPDTDHLNLTKLDDGGVVKDIERDEKGYVQVVCGAPNVRQDQMVVWLPPGVTVPATCNDEKPFVLDARQLRGVTSNGMIASAKELDLYDDHTGILEVVGDYAPGDHFAEVCDFSDVLLDIENKSLTHRPDTFGMIGFAREVAAIQGKKFNTPQWLLAESTSVHSQGQEKIKVAIDDSELCDRYQAVVIDGVDASQKSELAMQTWLARVGTRPINQPVDITNYLMLVTGQPLHAFDYEKLKNMNNGVVNIHVRRGRGKGDTLKLLDGRDIELHPEDIVIANGEKAVALAGAMGGSETEIDENTKTILLESASFNLYNLRATQMRHGIFSEAITRFTKGQPAALTAPVLAYAIKLFTEKKGQIISDIYDIYARKVQKTDIELDPHFVNTVLGTTLELKEIVEVLENIECPIEKHKEGALKVSPPYWRNDLNIPEDIVEEIGRIMGFDTINPSLPTRTYHAVKPSGFDTLRSKIANTLVRAGANEVLTYSFVHGNLLEKAGQSPEQSYKIVNSISPELQYYRQSLTPSLLQLVHTNSKAGFDEFMLFECNKTHSKLHGLTHEKVPQEMYMLAGVVASKKQPSKAPYYHAKAYLDYIAHALGIVLEYRPLDKRPDYPVTAPFEYRRSALVSDKETGESIGIIGEYTAQIKRNFKLPHYVAGFEIDPKVLEKISKNKIVSYTALSRYPSVERDICVKIKTDIYYTKVHEVIESVVAKTGLLYTLQPLDIYSPDDGSKHITLRITLASYDKTLTGDEVAEVEAEIAHALQAQLNGEII